MHKFKKLSLLLFLFLLGILLIQPLTLVITNQATYFSRGYAMRYDELKKTYYSSQYANKNHVGFIPDETLEAFEGGTYLLGINPILIHHDQPPMGRYIIALSIFLFDNEKTIPMFLVFLSGLGIYLISLQVLKNKFLALLPFGLFINQSIYLHKLTYLPLLETIQLPFILFAIYTFIIAVEKKKFIPWFMTIAILIGFVISIRYFILGLVLLCSFLLFLFLRKKFFMLSIMVSSAILSLLVLLATYTQTFKAGYSLIQVLGIQKYIFVYHKSAFVLPFSAWDLLLFNRWHTWWGDHAILSDAEWTFFWPLATLLILIYLLFVFLKKLTLNNAEVIILLWIVMYGAMISVGYSSTRYFLPLIPFLYILATSFVVKLLRTNFG